jgi:carboxypeptidase C (cathepsin A)
MFLHYSAASHIYIYPGSVLSDHAHLQVAHILFVDSPTGAGFSFSKQPQGYDIGEVSTSLQLHYFLIKVPS